MKSSTLTQHVKDFLPTSLKSRLLLGGLLSIAIVLIGISAYQAKYHLSSDAISYISIAKHYASGALKTAVNGYWSPAISWLMAPLVAIGIEGRTAFAVINCLAASVTLIGGSIIVWWQSRRNLFATAMFIVIMGLFLRSTITNFFPDLLLLAWTAVFITSLLWADSLLNRRTLNTDILSGGVLGIVGAVGYLTKLYALPFFIATIIGWALLRFIVYQRPPKEKLNPKTLIIFLRPYMITALALFTFMTPWVLALSVKYDYFTVGSSFSVNTSSVFDDISEKPKSSNGSTNQTTPAQKTKATLESVAVDSPPYATATTTTEDRTPATPTKPLKLSGSDSLKNFIERRKQAIPVYLNTLTKMWPPILVIITFTIITLVVTKGSYQKNRHIYLTLLAWLAYFSGYGLITRGGNERYFWPMLFLALLLSCFISMKLWGAKNRINLARLAAIFTFVILIVLTYQTYSFSLSDITKAPKIEKIEMVANRFKSEVKVNEYDDYLSNNGRHNRGFAYYVDGQAYGQLGAGHEFSQPAVREEIKKLGIDYFLNFSTKDQPPPEVAEYGAEIIWTYDLGDNFGRCQDTRQSTFDACMLYIIKP